MGKMEELTQNAFKAVVNVSSDGDIGDVRQGLGRLAALHHIGLATAGGLTLLQLFLGIGW